MPLCGAQDARCGRSATSLMTSSPCGSDAARSTIVASITAYLPTRPVTPVPAKRFKVATRLVRYHYQWLVVHDYHPTVTLPGIVDKFLVGGLTHYKPLITATRSLRWRTPVRGSASVTAWSGLRPPGRRVSMRGSREVVVDPDWMTTWTIHASG